MDRGYLAFFQQGIENRDRLIELMPTFSRPSLSFRTAGFPRYGWKAGM
jgi:hypothetical protein